MPPTGEEWLRPCEVETDAKKSCVRYDPLGAILAIMPWNFPYWQVFRAAVPAIAGGNVLVLKHAANVSGVALQIEELFVQAGFPTGVFTTLLLSRERMDDLIGHPAIRGVTLTGSERAGRSVAASAGRQIKPTVLELGGSDPFLILADADLSQVVPQAVRARTQNTGQSCIAAKRFLVDRSLARPFEEAFIHGNAEASRGGSPRPGNPDRPDGQGRFAGAVASSRFWARSPPVRDCVAAGSFFDRPGFFYEPTILADVQPGMPAFEEETFGPVAAIIPFENNQQAVNLANASNYGLGASIWTANRRCRRGTRAAH